MHLKRFEGPSLPDVMRQIREELGPEAVILHTRAARAWGLRRFVRGRGVEILAAVDHPEAARIQPAGRAARPAAPGSDELRADVAQIKRLLCAFAGPRLLHPAVVPCYERLVAAGVDASLAFRAVGALSRPGAEDLPGSPGELDRALEEILMGMMPVASPPTLARPGVIAVVGPTGAGKTTTVAKLAARGHLGGAAVRIVSLDGSGVGGPGPLEALAGIVGVPYTLALTPEDLARALGTSRTGALVLIDTFGLGPRDRAGAADLGRLLRAVSATEIHVVVSATTKREDALAATRAFSTLGATHLVFTHLDETASVGSLLSVSIEGGLPLSYFGTGREVPNDLRPAAPRELVQRVLQGEREP